jgi:hypothetical protein
MPSVQVPGLPELLDEALALLDAPPEPLALVEAVVLDALALMEAVVLDELVEAPPPVELELARVGIALPPAPADAAFSRS